MLRQVDPQQSNAVYPSKKEHRMWRPTVVLLLIVLTTAGCASMMPPQKIPVDRATYLEAVSTSWKEQLLSNLVSLRYGDTLTSLEMTSITTGYELDSNLTAGNSAYWHVLPATPAYAATSVGGSVTYSIKPSISYVPIRGDALEQTMLEPINPLKILKSLQTGWDADYILPFSVKCINDLRNPSDDQFIDLVNDFRDLLEKGVIRLTMEEPVEPKVTKVPDDYTVTLKYAAKPKQGKSCEEGTDKKKEDKEDSAVGLLVVDNARAKEKKLEKELGDFKKLLWPKYALEKEGMWRDLYKNKCRKCHEDPSKFQTCDLQKMTETFTCVHSGIHKIDKIKSSELKEITSFLKHSSEGYEVYKIIDANQKLPLDPYCEKIVMQTRSTLQALIVLSELIDVPRDHINEHRAKEIADKDKEPVLKDKLTIKNLKERPRDAYVAIKHCGFWFYIDDKDLSSKDIFSGTEGILSMAEKTTTQGVPILTLPVQ